MYVTRPLSLYRKSPSTLSTPSPDAPYSGYLVITDEEAEMQDTFCWGTCKRKKVSRLPFPQDKILTIVYTSDYQETYKTKVWFMPVPNQPLSSNLYYVIKAKGKHKGKASRCSRERDIMNCCITDIVRDKKPKPLNLTDIYQQVKIYRHPSGGFFAKSVAPDGLPPKFLRRKGWKVHSSSLHKSLLSEALGLDTNLRACLPELNISISKIRSASVIVGRWYCPFAFVREKYSRVKNQMRKSILYSMTLEQSWEQIYSCGNHSDNQRSNVVNVNVDVEREVAVICGGMEALKVDRNRGGFTWFVVQNPSGRKGVSGVGLSSAVVESIRWVLEVGGWINGEEEREMKVVRVEENTSESRWKMFGCYVLVESFVLRRMNGSLVLKWSFRHTHTVKSKWE